MGGAGDEPRGGSRNCQRKGRLRFWGLGLYLGLPPIFFVVFLVLLLSSPLVSAYVRLYHSIWYFIKSLGF